MRFENEDTIVTRILHKDALTNRSRQLCLTDSLRSWCNNGPPLDRPFAAVNIHYINVDIPLKKLVAVWTLDPLRHLRDKNWHSSPQARPRLLRTHSLPADMGIAILVCIGIQNLRE
jgi:hypothetical protein